MLNGFFKNDFGILAIAANFDGTVPREAFGRLLGGGWGLRAPVRP